MMTEKATIFPEYNRNFKVCGIHGELPPAFSYNA